MAPMMSATQAEQKHRLRLAQLIREAPVPDSELWSNMGLFLNRIELSRIFFMHELYQHALRVNGVVMEFGVRWGQNLALFVAMRGMLEPFNRSRKIIGFDTFAGFPSIHTKDGSGTPAYLGAFQVSKDYEQYLAELLAYHEVESPISHLRKFELVKGDATQTVPAYLQQHPETIISLAFFDFDLFEPTKLCLEAIRPYLVKGSVLGFDELNHPDWPGETQALREVFDMTKVSLRRSANSAFSSYFILE
jgi:hypothetical protein